VITLADPTGTSITYADMASGGGSSQTGGLIKSPEHVKQLSGETSHSKQTSLHDGQEDSPVS